MVAPGCQRHGCDIRGQVDRCGHRAVPMQQDGLTFDQRRNEEIRRWIATVGRGRRTGLVQDGFATGGQDRPLGEDHRLRRVEGHELDEAVPADQHLPVPHGPGVRAGIEPRRGAHVVADHDDLGRARISIVEGDRDARQGSNVPRVGSDEPVLGEAGCHPDQVAAVGEDDRILVEGHRRSHLLGQIGAAMIAVGEVDEGDHVRIEDHQLRVPHPAQEWRFEPRTLDVDRRRDGDRSRRGRGNGR